MASPRPIDLFAGLRDMTDSLKLPINTIQKHNNTSIKSGVRLDVAACHSQLKKSTSDGAEDVVMREAFELYCSLMSPPSTPLQAAPQEYRQNLHCVDSEDQYCSMSIHSSCTLASESPRKAEFSHPPTNTSLLSYPRDLTYNRSTASPFEHGTTDLEELDGQFAHQSATFSVLKPAIIGQSSYPACSTPPSSDEDDDDPFARQPGVSRAPTPHNLQRCSPSKSISTSTSPPRKVASMVSDSFETGLKSQHGQSLEPQQSNFGFPQGAHKSDAYSTSSHSSVTPATSDHSPNLHILPCYRTSSVAGSHISTMTSTQSTPPVVSHSFQSAKPSIAAKVHRFESGPVENKTKYQRARAMSVATFSRHGRSDQGLTISPPLLVPTHPTFCSQSIAVGTRKTATRSGSHVQGRSRSKALSNAQNAHPDSVLKPFSVAPPTVKPEEDESAKTTLPSIRKDGKSLWKTLKRKMSRTGTGGESNLSEILGPTPDCSEKNLGRATGGSGMRYPIPARHPTAL